MSPDAAKSVLFGKQRRAVGLLLAGRTQQEAAATVGVHLRTLQRWLLLPAFRQALSVGQDATLAAICASLGAGADSALKVLRDIFEDTTNTASTRTRAALGWLATMFRSRDDFELSERVAAIEQALAVQNGPN